MLSEVMFFGILEVKCALYLIVKVNCVEIVLLKSRIDVGFMLPLAKCNLTTLFIGNAAEE